MEKLYNDAPSNLWTFEECIDNRIAINELIDELSQLKSESQKRDEQVRKAIKHIVGCLAEPVNVKGWNEEYDKINEILNSTKE